MYEKENVLMLVNDENRFGQFFYKFILSIFFLVKKNSIFSEVDNLRVGLEILKIKCLNENVIEKFIESKNFKNSLIKEFKEVVVKLKIWNFMFYEYMLKK